MDKNSKPYIDGDFEDFFEAAESNNMAAEDVVLYSQSLSRLRSYQAGLDYRYEEGREEERLTIARNMLMRGMPVSDIAAVTGLPQSKILSLRESLLDEATEKI